MYIWFGHNFGLTVGKYSGLFLKGSVIISISVMIFAIADVISSPVHAATSGTTISITGPARPPGFSPDILTVHVNEQVTFFNNTFPNTTFTIQADNNSFITHPIAPEQQWSTQFSNPGTYSYHEIGHPTTMVGSIIVVASSVNLLPTISADQATQAIISLRHQEQQGARTTSSSSTFLLIGGSISVLVIITIVIIIVLLRRRALLQNIEHGKEVVK